MGEAIPEFETALALDRNLVGAFSSLGWCKLFTGSMEEAIPLAEQAIRLSPRDPGNGWQYLQIGTVHLLQSLTDEAIVWLEKARSAMPAGLIVRSALAAAYAMGRPSALPPNSPKSGSWTAEMFFQASPT
jgi:tetratricopeptide (TPR) repeat protein